MHVAPRSGAIHKIINGVLRSGAEITVLSRNLCFDVGFVFRPYAFLFRFLSNKQIYLGFRTNYLLSGVKWPIEIEFVIENVIKQPRARKENS